MKVNSLRLSYSEIELIQATIKQVIDGAGVLMAAGTMDTVASMNFLGVGGFEMDEQTDEQYREMMMIRVNELKDLSNKLKRISGV